MKIQPLLLTRPTLLPGRINGLEVTGAPAVANQPAKPGQTQDTVEISPAAEAQLALQLSPEETEQVQELQKTDQEVRAHEQAHLAAAGPYAQGGPTYEYQTGPDGRQYAIGGEVQIDTSPVAGDPEATIQKARVIRAAASAPSEPSGQDRAVAAQASQMEAQARQELLEQQQTEQSTQADPTQASLAVAGAGPSNSADASVKSTLAFSQLSPAESYGRPRKLSGTIFDALT